jgi:hypothetical protein
MFEGYTEVGWSEEEQPYMEAARRKEGKLISPKTWPSVEQQTEEEYCAFEREIDVFLMAFEGEGLEWMDDQFQER